MFLLLLLLSKGVQNLKQISCWVLLLLLFSTGVQNGNGLHGGRCCCCCFQQGCKMEIDELLGVAVIEILSTGYAKRD